MLAPANSKMGRQDSGIDSFKAISPFVDNPFIVLLSRWAVNHQKDASNCRSKRVVLKDFIHHKFIVRGYCHKLSE